ncbi:energy-coupling factor transporter transmembrane component T family protein [Microbacterium allomyrinae]|uniref:Energy-coupling factor transporter transmembrane protein EcfT n=1 Tax=Microbacterium allomyrinae TaxID=2830666 RepID=A0A9X1LTB5_9MICO|nr:energy-coupling factor transporter transmembrane protein EcfT [Microbacterium allomyrinae]MCC2031268.1 energy-coupling factor transporter transmembrane protein EcfT [Microbacterium allomyrinae]
MLTLYRPGDSWLYRLPAGPKTLLLLMSVFGVLLLPSAWWTAGAAAGISLVAYALAGLDDGAWGVRELGRQLFAVRWAILFTLAGQLLFLGPEAAVANTARVTASLVLAGLLVLTTRVSDLLDAFERGLRPLRRIGVDSERAALLLTVTLGTVPVLARLAGEVREAQRARGARASLRLFVVPFLVVSLKHADQLGDALAARGLQ